MKKILIVDDSITERKIIKEMLLSEGFSFVELKSGEEAIELVLEINPDLIIMDVLMSGLNGFQATKQIKQLNNSIPIIICTSKDDEENMFWGMKQGANAYVTKPIKKELLIKEIKNILEINNE